MKTKLIAITFFLVVCGLIFLAKTDIKSQSFAEKTTAIETLTVAKPFGYHRFFGRYNRVYIVVLDSVDATRDSLLISIFTPPFSSLSAVGLRYLFTNTTYNYTSNNGVSIYEVYGTGAIDSLRVWFSNASRTTNGRTRYYFRLVNTY